MTLGTDTLGYVDNYLQLEHVTEFALVNPFRYHVLVDLQPKHDPAPHLVPI